MENILAYKDFTIDDIKNNKDRDFIDNFKQFYQGNFYIKSKIINKNKMRVFLIAGIC